MACFHQRRLFYMNKEEEEGSMQHVHLPPLIGLGTFRCTGDTVRKSVKVAIDSGIRHIDTASIYKVSLIVHVLQSFDRYSPRK